ncbi:hypothetical protein D3C80_2031720 [compost metagenome]
MGGVAAVEQTLAGVGQFDRLWRGGQVEVDAQRAAITQAPACAEGFFAVDLGTECAAAGQLRYDVAAAQVEQLLVEAMPAGDHLMAVRT